MKVRLVLVLTAVLGVAVLSACLSTRYDRGSRFFDGIVPGPYDVVAPYPAKILVESGGDHKKDAVLFIDLPADAQNIHWAVIVEDGKYQETPFLTYTDSRGYHYQLTFPYIEIKTSDGVKRFAGRRIKEIRAQPVK